MEAKQVETLYCVCMRNCLHLKQRAKLDGKPTWQTITLEPSWKTHTQRHTHIDPCWHELSTLWFISVLQWGPAYPCWHTHSSICQPFMQESSLRVGGVEWGSQSGIWHTLVHSWGAVIAMVSNKLRDQSRDWCTVQWTVYLSALQCLPDMKCDSKPCCHCQCSFSSAYLHILHTRCIYQ